MEVVMSNLTITFEVNDEDAWSFAQVLKRMGYSEYRSFSVSEVDAYRAQAAAEKISEAFAEKGVNPR
jgi:hypothetical protein